jgi:hypothetical protein
MEEGMREKFIKIYSNLPLGIRQEIILVLEDGKPITWNATFIEVEARTPLSEEILKKLEKLEII